MSNTYQYGNTVRLVCTFTDFKGDLVDPSVVKVIFYDYTYTKIDEHTLLPHNKISTGKYYFDYVIPHDRRDRIYYEWYGEIDGNPALRRGELKVVFV